jgi:hypothetical protein
MTGGEAEAGSALGASRIANATKRAANRPLRFKIERG